VEEGNLRGIHTSGTGRNDNIDVGDDSNFSGSLNGVSFNDGF